MFKIFNNFAFFITVTLGLIIPEVINKQIAIASSFKLTNTLIDPVLGGGFGVSSAIQGDRVIVGDSAETVEGNESAGAAYLFNSSTGELLQIFNNPEPEQAIDGQSDQFANSVAIDGDKILIGTGFANKAYLFDSNTGSLLQTFDGNDVGIGDNNGDFGFSVAIDGNNLIIGTARNSINPANLAFLFDANTGNLLQTFSAERTISTPVAIDKSKVVIGSFQDQKAFLQDIETGNVLQTFSDSRGNFGISVDIDENKVIIGSQNGEFANLYDGDTGELLQEYSNPTSQSSQFSDSVAIDGDNVLIGARFYDTGDTSVTRDTGAAYLYNTQGSIIQTFINPEMGRGDEFGRSVAIDRNRLVITAPFSDIGTAYIYEPKPKTVPEPSTILGLGLITTFAIGTSFKRKKK